MSLGTRLGTFLYRGVEFISMNVSASHKVTMTLDYRRRWHEFVPEFPPKKPTLWIHGASVGELEDLAAFYGNPQLLKEAGYSESQLVLTSSSGSAEEFLLKMKRKLNPFYAGPLPPDILPRIEQFFDRLQPDLLILSQSDTWPVLMSVAKKKLKKGAIWLPHKDSSASWSKKWLLAPIVKLVGLRREDSKNPLPQIKSAFIGSPRVDRILDRIDKSQNKDHPLKDYIKHSPGKIKILLGSAWKEDARLIRETLNILREEDQKIVEVFAIPHEPKNSAEISAVSVYLGKNVILEEGILLESYQNFDLAFVGGGFRTGLHNIVEPLAWGIPTVCGPELKKQPEAPYYVAQGSLKTVRNAQEFRDYLLMFLRNDKGAQDWNEKAKEARKILNSQRGASQRLAELVSKF